MFPSFILYILSKSTNKYIVITGHKRCTLPIVTKTVYDLCTVYEEHAILTDKKIVL